MDKNFDKILIGLMAAAFIALPFLNSSAQASEKGEGLIGSYGLINEYPGIMRFHVVANSDSTEDQDLKTEVRDYVLSKEAYSRIYRKQPSPDRMLGGRSHRLPGV